MGRAGDTPDSNKVSFTKASAQRIADAVRKVEQGNRDAIPFIGAPRMSGGGGGIKIRKASFTGDWAIGESKVVEYCDTTATAEVTNFTCHYEAPDSGEGVVLFAKACGTNAVLELDMDQCKNIGGAIKNIAGFNDSQVQILGHDESGCLKWFDVYDCPSTAS